MLQRHWTARPVLAALIVAAAAVLCARAIVIDQRDRLSSVVEAFGREFATKLEERLTSRLDTAEILRIVSGNYPGSEKEAFTRLARALHQRSEDFQALNWANADGVIEVVTPLEGNRAALGLDVTRLPAPAEAIAMALETGAVRTTPPITLAQGGRGFVAYLPVFQGEELRGFINVVFRTAPLIDSVLGPEAARAFHIRITDEGASIRAAEFDDEAARFAAVQRIPVGGRTWSLTIAPQPSTIAGFRSFLDEGVLAFGFLAAVILGFALSEADRNRQALRDREERFDLAMKGAADGLFDWNAETGETYYSPRWFQMLGYEPGELEPGLETFLSLLHPDDLPEIREKRRNPDHSEDVAEEEFRMRHKDGSWVNILSRATVLRKADAVKRIVGTHVDITELRRQQKELEIAAMTDDLTGLRNRRGLPSAIGAAVGQLAEHERLAVMHLDLDMFKSVNDTYGHEAGDHALRVVAQRLAADPARFGILARVGGDEFVLAKRTFAADERVLQYADTTIDRISEPFDYNGNTCRLGASIGVSFIDSADFSEVERTIAHADIALSAAKRLGRGRSLVFQKDMQKDALHSARLSIEIDEALAREEFKPFFQPQTEILSGACIGLEALVRWQHPVRGLLQAGDFVPCAESSHLIAAIDRAVFHESCRVLTTLPALGLPDATISVNLSTNQLKEPSLADRLAAIAMETGAEVSKLRVELLESTLLTDRNAHVARNIHELAEIGFNIDLDDFGTGHAAISSLLDFPISRVKLDRSLVTNVHHDTRRQAVVNAILEMSHSLSVEVLAEGVETEDELRYLASSGCQFAQGYHIGMPMPLPELERWVSERNEERAPPLSFGRAS